jgi:drug/metabolite transporter (DMT)-like permease
MAIVDETVAAVALPSIQRDLDLSTAQAGLGLLPVAFGIGITSLTIFPCIRRVRVAYPAGLVAVVAGMALLVRAPVDGRYPVDVLPSALLFALGGGFVLPAAMTLAMSTATPQTAGVPSGLINTSQQVGGAVGLATLATLAAHAPPPPGTTRKARSWPAST